MILEITALSLTTSTGIAFADVFDHSRHYAVVNADNVSLIPGELSFEQAAVLPSDGFTALTGLEKVLGLKSGESLMVFGASGGVGHLAIQLAKLEFEGS